MKPRRRRLWVIASVAAALLVAAEVGARSYGLGNPPLYVSDPDSSYALKPNQDIKRFGNRIHINQWGMRSEDVAETPPPGATRILFLGDSVTWGGAYEDQSTTFPYLVAKDLDAMKWGPVETLNPSCGGWAPGNELGWLKGHGTFKSRLVVLVINEGDLDQPKEADVSGRHPNYPRQASVFALQELMSRYVLPRITHSNTNDPGSQQGAFDAAAAVESRRAVLDEIDLAQKRDAKVIVLFTKRDPADPKDNWVPAMADKLRATVQRHGARFVVANLTTHAQYHDGLHPNALGNQAIASQLARIIPQVLGQSPATTSRK